jgi:hypothetical protein
MSKDTPIARDQHPPELSAAAQQEWNEHVEAVLRGVAHALNNRSAALSALIQLSDDGEGAATLRGILATELDRVMGLAAAIRSIGTPRAGEEAFAPGDAASEALEVLQLHSDMRNVAAQLEVRDAAPVRVQRWMFVRSLIVLAVHAARAGGRVELASAGDDLVARVSGATPEPSVYVREVARAMGGEALDAGRGFRLPTLATLRRREGS